MSDISKSYKWKVIVAILLISSLVICLICYMKYCSRRYDDFSEAWANYEYDFDNDKVIRDGTMNVTIADGKITVTNSDFNYGYDIESEGVDGRIYRKAIDLEDHKVSFDYCANIDCVLIVRTDSNDRLTDITFGIKEDIPLFIYSDKRIRALMNDLSGGLIDILTVE